MPLTRQLREAQDSRDLWKKRAALKQRGLKKLRITVRDLGVSRDLWHDRCVKLQSQVEDLKQQLAQTQQQLAQAQREASCLGGA
jgi:hypothetical protein